MKELIFGTGIAHSILLFSFVIGGGLLLGKWKIKGISIGSTWILFVGILMSHFGFLSHPVVLAFMKDFGLILFVFSIGLQVGPGFFHSFRAGGVKLNVLALVLVLLSVLVTWLIHLVTGEDLQTMTGVMSAAVTNTPGLGAAQQTVMDAYAAEGLSAESAAETSSRMASAYAVAYPFGVLGVIFLLMLAKRLFRIDLEKEQQALKVSGGEVESARRMHCEVENPAIFGKALRDVVLDLGDQFVVSRIMRDGVISIPGPDTVLRQGDRLLIVTTPRNVDAIRIIFGEEVPMHVSDWQKMDDVMVTRRLAITKSSMTGKRLRELNIRKAYGVTVTRVLRAGIELVARADLILQMGDTIQVVGPKSNIQDVARLVGNEPETLSHPNLVPIFFGIVLGVIFGFLPIRFPGIPQPVRLGLAGGPLMVAILLGHFGPQLKITTYTTLSANMMIREIGISFFMAAVGLGAGQGFVSSLVGGGYWWILYGALITLIPVALIIVIARVLCKLNFYQICGLVTGGTTNAPVLSFAQSAYGTDYTSVNYATVYPLTMFLRVLVAQLLILIAL